MLPLSYSEHPVRVEMFSSGKRERQAAGGQLSAREADREEIDIHPFHAADDFIGSIILYPGG